MTQTVQDASTACALLHRLARQREFFTFPFDKTRIPRDGIYLLFERGEISHGGPRVVRVGTHTGQGQLPSRLQQHFVREAKDRSIFRKNIGRCLLSARCDAYLSAWETDLTSRAAKESAPEGFDRSRQLQIEKEVSDILRERFSFVVIPIESKADRLRLESGLASLLYLCHECAPSGEWLGRYSPKGLIRESGLWQVNGLRGHPLGMDELASLLS